MTRKGNSTGKAQHGQAAGSKPGAAGSKLGARVQAAERAEEALPLKPAGGKQPKPAALTQHANGTTNGVAAQSTALAAAKRKSTSSSGKRGANSRSQEALEDEGLEEPNPPVAAPPAKRLKKGAAPAPPVPAAAPAEPAQQVRLGFCVLYCIHFCLYPCLCATWLSSSCSRSSWLWVPPTDDEKLGRAGKHGATFAMWVMLDVPLQFSCTHCIGHASLPAGLVADD